MKSVVCSAPGKLILTGEHSVVYGEPALLAAIGMRTTAEVRARNDFNIRLSSEQLRERKELTVEAISIFWKEARKAWEEFYSKRKRQNKRSKLDELRRDQYLVLKAAIGELVHRMGGFDVGLSIDVDSEISLGSGLGSSASVATAVIGALSRFFGKQISLESLNEMVYATEQVMHGNPSGGDNTAVVYGGLLAFQKKAGRGFRFQRLRMKKKDLAKVILVDSGRPSETTGEVVEKVKSTIKSPRQRSGRQKSNVNKIIQKMGEVSREFIADLRKGKVNTDSIKENQRLLEELGVVGERAKAMIQAIEVMGGVGKICGAGGIKAGSGMLLAYHRDRESLDNFLSKKRWRYFSVEIGVEGVRWNR